MIDGNLSMANSLELNPENPEYFSNKLSKAELERLALIVEEAAEVQQIAMKIIRHGYESCNPFDKEKKTNRELLEKELGDFDVARRLLINRGDASEDKINSAFSRKCETIKKYLHYNTIHEPSNRKECVSKSKMQ